AGQLSQDPGLDMVPVLEGPDQEPPPGVVLNLIREGQEVVLVQDLNPLIEGQHLKALDPDLAQVR
ncbi:unnamed protein product, partial [Rotaria socialis]